MSGYDFTPLPDAPRRVGRPEARFDRRLPGMLFGRATLTYACDQPVHVGAGHKVVVDGEPVRAQIRRGAEPVVPGSTWKGVVRARFEAISRACAGRPPRSQKRLVSQSFGGFSAELSSAAQNHPVFSQCRTRAGDSAPEVCPACALFGLMNRRSRVSFGDLVADRTVEHQRIALQFGPRLHHLAVMEDVTVDRQRRRLTIRQLRGRKFHGGQGPSTPSALLIETIPRGSTLKGELRFFNVTPSEMGGLLTALGGLRGPFVKLGAGKNLGFGRVRLTGVRFDLRDHFGRAVQFDPQAPKAWGQAHAQSPDRWADGEDALVAMHRRGGW